MARSPFVNCRARFQRISDGKFFAGWILAFTPEYIRARLTTAGSVQEGDRMGIQINGVDGCATIQGWVSTVDEDVREITFVTEGKPRFLDPVENIRVAVENFRVTISTETGEVEATVLDISTAGLGILCSIQLARGATITLTAAGENWSAPFTAEVRYCRKQADSADYRVGLLITQMARLDSARWARLVDGTSAAA